MIKIFSKNNFKYCVISLFFLGMSYRFFSFIEKYSVNILFWDQWAFYTGLFNNSNLWDLFLWQHGPHRMGLGLILIKTLAFFTDWDTKWESIVIGIIFLLSSGFALLLKYRLFNRLEFYDIVIPVLFLNIAQFEIFIGAINPSHGPLPLFMLVLFSLSMTLRNFYLKNSIMLLLNAFQIYTGFGIMMGVITPLIILIDIIKNKGKRIIPLIIFLFISLLTFSSFFINYTFSPSASCYKFPHERPLEYLIFIGIMFKSFLGLKSMSIYSVIFFYLTPFLLLYVVAINVVKLCRSQGKSFYLPLIILVLFAFSMIFSLSTAIGRVCTGIGNASASRYVPYLIPAFFSIFLSFQCIKWNKLRNIALSVFLIAIIFFEFRNKPVDDYFIYDYLSFRKSAWKECYLHFNDIEKCNEMTGSNISANDSDVKWKLDYLKANRLNLFNARGSGMPEWENLKKVSGGLGHMQVEIIGEKINPEKSQSKIISKGKNVIFSGWAIDDIEKNGEVKAYLALHSNREQIIIPTRKMLRTDTTQFEVNSYRFSGWRTILLAKDYQNKCYGLSLRILRLNGKEYFELPGSDRFCF